MFMPLLSPIDLITMCISKIKLDTMSCYVSEASLKPSSRLSTEATGTSSYMRPSPQGGRWSAQFPQNCAQSVVSSAIAALTPHQQSLFLLWKLWQRYTTDQNAESVNTGCLAPNALSIMQPLILRLRQKWGKRGRADSKSRRIRVTAVRLCLSGVT